jgi:hypothetical protein
VHGQQRNQQTGAIEVTFEPILDHQPAARRIEQGKDGKL